MIPNVFHFIFYVKPVLGQAPMPFMFHHYLALRSCIETQQPDRVVIHTDGQIEGEWWERIKDQVEVRHREFRTTVNGRQVSHGNSPADIARIEILLAEGGVYADIDTLFVGSIRSLLDSEHVFVQLESENTPMASLVAARAGHPVLHRWLEHIDLTTDGQWSSFTCKVVNILASEFPGQVIVAQLDRMDQPAWTDVGRALLYRSDVDHHGSLLFNMCQGKTLSDLQSVTPDTLFEYNSTFNRQARRFYERPKLDFTAIMPVQIEHQDRLENILAVTSYMLDQLCVDNLIVVEGGERPRLAGILDPRIRYSFVTIDEEQPWSRSKMFNTALPWVTTKSVAIWDTDVIMSLTQLRSAVISIVEHGRSGCVCYENMYHVRRQFLKEIKAGQFNYGIVNDPENVTFETGLGNAAGAFVVSTAVIKHMRGMNELFWGWGGEDDDMLIRLLRLTNGDCIKISGPLIHIEHARTDRSQPHPDHVLRSQTMRYRIISWPVPRLLHFFGIEPGICDYCSQTYPDMPTEEEMGPLMEMENGLPGGRPMNVPQATRSYSKSEEQ